MKGEKMSKNKSHVTSTKIRQTPSRIVFVVFNTLFLSLFAFICILPILHVLFASFSDPDWLNAHAGIVWFPNGFNIVGYELVFQNSELMRGLLNSVIYVALHLIIGLALALTGGYVLAKPDILWKNSIMLIISFTMLFNGGMIPTYLNLQRFGMLNTIWAVVVPGSLSVMNLILIREGFKTVPLSLLESARLDGANEWQILWHISMPLIKASIATVSLYLVIGMWNSWFPAAMYLGGTRKLYPMQLILREILIVNQDAISNDAMLAEDGVSKYRDLVKYSTIIISSLPMLVFYPFIMKYFKSGVKVGAVKG